MGLFTDPFSVQQGRETMKPKLLVFLLWVPLSIAVAAQDTSKVIAMENAWNQAELKNDASAVQLLLADDFIMTTAEAELYNKSQIVASIRDKSYNPDVLQSSEMVVHAHGSTAVVTGIYYEKGTEKGKTWERRGRFTDTWMFMNNRWQCVASHFSVKSK
jgi:ketosteroid isomerase-like protein